MELPLICKKHILGFVDGEVNSKCYFRAKENELILELGARICNPDLGFSRSSYKFGF